MYPFLLIFVAIMISFLLENFLNFGRFFFYRNNDLKEKIISNFKFSVPNWKCRFNWDNFKVSLDLSEEFERQDKLLKITKKTYYRSVHCVQYKRCTAHVALLFLTSAGRYLNIYCRIIKKTYHYTCAHMWKKELYKNQNKC